MSDDRNSVVDAWSENYHNRQKGLVLAVRQLILDTDPRITEMIKWQAPTFIYKGNIASSIPIHQAGFADVPYRCLTR